MAYDLTGTVKVILDEQTFSSGFTKREFVVTSEEDKFPQEIKFECLKDKTSLVAGLKPGDKVKVSFNLNGREWQGKYFVNLSAWKVDVLNPDEPGAPESTDMDQEPF